MDPFQPDRAPFSSSGFFARIKSLFSSKDKPVLRPGGDQRPRYQQPPGQSTDEFARHWNKQFQHGSAAPHQQTSSAGAANQQEATVGSNGYGFVPKSPHSINKTRATIQFTLAVIVAAIPISYYMVQPDNLRDAIASIGGKKGLPPPQFQSDNSAAKVSTLKQDKAMRVADSGIRPSESVDDALTESALEHAEKHANPNYICPMHPEVITDDPNAICPICGMDLVLLESGGDTGVVKLTPQVINSLGVRTAKVSRRTLYRRIDSVGYINIDENNMRSINLRTDGWMEHLAVKTEGERVTKGQLLFEIYSPKLVNAQEEYVQAMEDENHLLLKASRERLRALGVSDEQIELLESTKQVEQLVKVFAPQPGIVSALRVREGVYVKPSQSVIDLVDLSSVWLMVDVFERQSDWVEVGQRAEASLPFMPGKTWDGTVEYVYPSIDASTRSLKVRLRFDNLEEELKPNMYADVTIFAKPKRKILAIPKEALIVTGNQQRVIISLGEGRFVPMTVGVGIEADDKVEITRGLSEGDEVVTSSQFLIDSESSLKASLARMAGGS